MTEKENHPCTQKIYNSESVHYTAYTSGKYQTLEKYLLSDLILIFKLMRTIAQMKPFKILGRLVEFKRKCIGTLKTYHNLKRETWKYAKGTKHPLIEGDCEPIELLDQRHTERHTKVVQGSYTKCHFVFLTSPKYWKFQLIHSEMSRSRRNRARVNHHPNTPGPRPLMRS